MRNIFDENRKILAVIKDENIRHAMEAVLNELHIIYDLSKIKNFYKKIIVLMWILIVNIIKNMKVENFTWELLCELHHVDIYNSLKNIEKDYVNYSKVIQKIFKEYEEKNILLGSLKFEEIVNLLYMKLVEIKSIGTYRNIEEIVQFTEYIVVSGRNKSPRFSSLDKSSELFKFVLTNYPINTPYQHLCSARIYLPNFERNYLVNINCNVDNPFVKNMIKKFCEVLVERNFKTQVDVKYIRIFSYYLGEVCQEYKINNYNDFTIEILKILFNRLVVIAEKNNITHTAEKIESYSIHFYRFLIEQYFRETGECLFEKKYEIIILSKSARRVLSENYEVLYYNRYEEVPNSYKMCIVPNEYTKRSSDMANVDLIYVDLYKIPLKYREEYREFLWKEKSSILSKCNGTSFIVDFFERLEVFKKSVKNINVIRDGYIDEFLYQYRIEKELQYDNGNGLKSVLKAIRKYLKYYSVKYNITNYSLKPLSLKGLDKICGGIVITEHDRKIIYKSFLNKESIEKYGKLFTIVFELFLSSNFRIGEILNIEVDSLYEEKVTGNFYLNYYSKSKSGTKKRTLLTPEFARGLKDGLEYTSEFRGNEYNSNYIFVHPYKRHIGKSLKRIDFYNYFINIIEEQKDNLDRSDYYPYNIRHTFINNVQIEGRKAGLTSKQIEKITGNSFRTITKYYEDKDNIELMAEIMAGTTFSNVSVSGEICLEEISGYNNVKDNLGYCKKDECIFDIAECLRCNSFFTSICRIPIFEEKIKICDQEILDTNNKLKKEEKVAEKKLLARYIVEMYRVKGEMS